MSWERRENAFVETLNTIDADVFAFQEMETFSGSSFNPENVQLETVQSNFAQYNIAASGDAATFPNTQPIAYRRSRFDLLDQGFFFFSDTPDVIYSRPWVDSWPSFASWAFFDDRATGTKFYVYNVHFEHLRARNRRRSSLLVLERIKQRDHPDATVVVVGDFNAPRSYPAVRRFCSIGLRPVQPRGTTFHFNRGLHIVPGIDHILLPRHAKRTANGIERIRIDDVWPSDHYPVWVEFDW